ncbi:hypothetical protein KAFR_0H00120 [Kazachstania africana CBS 2517]|uniref:Suppressor of lethality of KEX2 GAS1 double null mutant protein 1 n=1 Tax=Kazachstania africana (strain ATCC 22294 / BCRC 22015 / CBS 2517 / CECT 1963 / NBRC 1671 / NRRL Y-8276) TaxID=1071382 RepID=H2AYL6_KAZAF|nr:hypothetical protein KAFR_0H00120 [Kazachstania africana CBS 2517]CCF59422.1 hypothetical protein KAFR_0H00120 [Kazachstania africana CBS 2517]
MSSISIAVGCAVGIPVGVGVIVACAFWIRLQKRFKDEFVADADVENPAHSDAEVLNFNNLSSLEVKQGSVDRDNKVNNNYIPAYRKKMRSLRLNEHQRPNLERSDISSSATPTGATNHDASSITSFSNSSINKFKPSIYDQMIPVLDDTKSGFFSEKASTLSLHTNANNKNETLMKNISADDLDLGSYYPRRPSSNLSKLNLANHSNPSFHTRTSSMTSLSKPSNNIPNVFATPKTTDTNDVTDTYYLKNNYNIDDENQITEEDQYENEFTNYSENKRQFIDSLKPK